MAKENILVIKLSALGDFILAMGAMEAIRKQHCNAHITLLTTRPFKDIAERSGYFDEVVIDGRPKLYELDKWYKLLSLFNRNHFSRVYDLQFNDRTKIYRQMFVKKPEWSGVIPNSPLFYPNPDWRNMHSYKRHKEVLNIAGVEMHLPDISWMKTDVSHLGVKKPYVLFIPGSAPQHPAKRWSAIRYGGLGLKLIRDGYNIVLIGSDSEQDAVDKIKKACPEARDLLGSTSFYDIYSLAAESAGVVGNDTGPSHIAALSGVPMISLFCSQVSKPELSAPIGDMVKVIEANDLEDVSVNDVYNSFEPRGE